MNGNLLNMSYLKSISINLQVTLDLGHYFATRKIISMIFKIKRKKYQGLVTITTTSIVQDHNLEKWIQVKERR